MTIRASIIGITGYTGLEQLRMLLAHPQVEIAYLTSRQHDNLPIGEIYPHLAHLDLKITNTEHAEVAKNSDVVFLALPHKTAQDVVAELHGKVKLIDHSADYRLDDIVTYEKFYGPHAHPKLLSDVVYGAVEINKEKIKKAQTVANPGCFALLGQLMLLPFAGAIEHVDLFAITGSSGAGKTPIDGTHHPVRNHNIKSYNINAHRHIPEIIRTAKLSESQLNFVPTSGPFARGIFATAFVQGTLKNPGELYAPHPFIRLTNEVALANIVGSNYCDLSYKKISDTNYIVQGALDNLTKGAAGNATQCMNLMFGLDETLGLSTLAPLYP
jgi:N-acetyl-gamma-glutamyl-phosphate reductase common form